MKQHPIFKHITINEEGTKVFSTISNKYLKLRKNCHGYIVCCITLEKNKYKMYRVHRLVAETYYGYKDLSWDVHHIDHDKSNNHKDNLMWCTRSHNIREAIDAGVNPSRGETHPHAKLSDDQVHTICKMLEEGYRNCDISSEMNIHKDVVSGIRIGRSWSHISKQYNISVQRKKRLSVEKVMLICDMLEDGLSISEISKITKVNKITVERIKKRQVYPKISSEYSF